MEAISFHAHWWDELSGTCVIAAGAKLFAWRGLCNLNLMSKRCGESSVSVLIAYGTGHIHEENGIKITLL